MGLAHGSSLPKLRLLVPYIGLVRDRELISSDLRYLLTLDSTTHGEKTLETLDDADIPVTSTRL